MQPNPCRTTEFGRRINSCAREEGKNPLPAQALFGRNTLLVFNFGLRRRMMELVSQIPDVDAFLALAPEDLAARMLCLLKRRGSDMFICSGLENELWGGTAGLGPTYPRNRQSDVHLAFAEAWAWLEAQGLLVPAGRNKRRQWMAPSESTSAPIR